jgi:hypothetical protein
MRQPTMRQPTMEWPIDPGHDANTVLSATFGAPGHRATSYDRSCGVRFE